MATAAWNKAIVANDRPALERMMTEDFVLTSGDMTQWVPRGAWLDNLGKMRIASYQARVTDVRVYGQIAIAEVRGSWDMTMGSERRTTAFHLADTWVLRDGRWQVMRRYMIR
jgi:ketosteroid isomerase-like protein